MWAFIFHIVITYRYQAAPVIIWSIISVILLLLPSVMRYVAISLLAALVGWILIDTSKSEPQKPRRGLANDRP